MPLGRFRLVAIGAVVLGAGCGVHVAVGGEPSISERIDQHIAERWTAAGVVPAAPADDAELLRRLYLDLAGVIPTAYEARDFLDDHRPEKCAELIDRLLSSPAHATHLADLWRELMLPRRFDPAQAAGIIGVQNWLRRQFVDQRRYDRMVADLLVATGGDESGPAPFYTSVGLKPEELGTTTARIFLGLRLDYAQCHNHPFERWTQQDFWGYAAFFARLEQRSRNAANVRLVNAELGEVRLPETDTVVPTRVSGRHACRSERGSVRAARAVGDLDGVRDNPYLSRATVNLVWAQPLRPRARRAARRFR